MGSFLIRCGASGQVISEDDKVMVLPIYKSGASRPVSLQRGSFSTTGEPMRSESDCCSPQQFWRVFSAPIQGFYNDYGRIAIEDSPATRSSVGALLMKLKHFSAVSLGGEESFHEPEYDFDKILQGLPAVEAAPQTDSGAADLSDVAWGEIEKAWNSLQGLQQQERIFVMSATGNPQRPYRPAQFSFAVFHTSAWDYLVQSGRAFWEQNNFRQVVLDSFILGFVSEAISEFAALTQPIEYRYYWLGARLAPLRQSFPGLSGTWAVDILERQPAISELQERLVQTLQQELRTPLFLMGMDRAGLNLGPVVHAGAGLRQRVR